MAKDDVKPDLVISSPARRALTTARIIARKLGCRVRDIRVDDRLYALGADALLRVIRGLGDKRKSVMLVGHNPELAELAHHLSNRITYLPTCAIALVELDARSWSRAGKDKPARVMLCTPGQS